MQSTAQETVGTIRTRFYSNNLTIVLLIERSEMIKLDGSWHVCAIDLITGRFGKKMPRTTWRPIASLLIAVTLWGFAPVGNRYLVVRYDPLAVVTLRFALSSIVFLPLLRGLRTRTGNLRSVWILLISGILGICGYNLLVTLGQQTTSAGTVGLILASEPLWILLIWCLVERRKPGARPAIGACIGLIGIILVITAEHDIDLTASANLAGPVLVLCSAIAWSIYCVVMRRVSAAYGTIRGSALSVQIGTLPLLTAGAVPAMHLAVDLSPIAWLVILGLAIGCTVIALLLWNQASAEIGAPRAGPFLYLVPVISVVGGALFLGERQPLQVLMGGAIVLSGVIIASTQPRSSPQTGMIQDTE